MFWLTVLCLTLRAQAPDPTGWSGEMVANQPATIESETELSNEIRAQIGLAISLANQVVDVRRFAVVGQTTQPDLPIFCPTKLNNSHRPNGIQSSIKVALLLATLSLAPAIILMTTCYIRVIVVLSLLRQAFGGQQLPPTQVMTALSVFLTFLIMTPVWSEVKTSAIDPYTQSRKWHQLGRSLEPRCRAGQEVHDSPDRNGGQ